MSGFHHFVALVGQRFLIPEQPRTPIEDRSSWVTTISDMTSLPPITGPNPELPNPDQFASITVRLRRSELRMFLLMLPETVDYLEVQFLNET
jgi:hypothetical protein